MLIISNPDAQIMAAEAGELDIVSDIARPSDIDRLSANKNLQMSLARGMHAFFCCSTTAPRPGMIRMCAAPPRWRSTAAASSA